MASKALIEAVAVTAELCGRTLSDVAARVFVTDLDAYPEHEVIAALTKCRKEVRGALTVSDVVSRLDDGRPGPDEAWAMLPRSEDQTVVWTAEMAHAFGVSSLVDDQQAARMAFREAYKRAVSVNRDMGVRAVWNVSLGHDTRGRTSAVAIAVQEGKLTVEHARSICPALTIEDKSPVRIKRLVEAMTRRIA